MTLTLLVALLVALYSFQSLFTRLYTRQYQGNNAEMAAPVFSVCYGSFIALVSLIAGGFSFSPSWRTWLFGLAGGAVLLLYNVSMIESGKRGSYSFLMISSMFGGILIPLAAGVLFMGERLSALQICAVALMLLALAVMNSRGLSVRGAAPKYLLWCALLFAANGLYGTLMNAQATLLNGAESAEMLVILYGSSVLLAVGREHALGRRKELRDGFHMGKGAVWMLLICCASATAAARLLLWVLARMDSGILYTVENGGVLTLSILYSILLFRERPSAWQALGMLMALASVVMIGL
ncbi:MAG: hypothetical protein II912_07785 [Clostridia bacterium]|nr:hypothetical protein [Clostridia bacterium]